MESFIANFTDTECDVGPTLYTTADSVNDPNHMSRAVKWMYFFAIPSLTTMIWLLWAFVLRLYLLRRFYEKQGIRFVKNCYAVLGAEMQVSTLQGKNKSHDWLYTGNPTNIFGTVRGFSVQLYGTSADVCEKLIAKTGNHVDRDSPALFSFGQLSPDALSFQSINKSRFKERKVTMTRGLNDNKRLYDVVNQQVETALEHFKVNDGSGTIINIRDLLNHWTRETAGEFTWGKSNIDRSLEVLDFEGNLRTFPFMTALNHTFTDLRFYAGRFWNRVCFPLAALPLTKEARRLDYNIKVLRKAIEDMMTTPEEGAVAANIQEANSALGIENKITRDDLTTATIAGLDPVKTTVMGTLFHLLKPENLSWRQQILAEIIELRAAPGEMHMKLSHASKLDAFMYEAMRYEPPGSLINNAAVKDFDLAVDGRQYRIKSGTRIVTCIHALHQNEDSWKKRVADDMAPLDEFDPSRFLNRSGNIVSSSCFMPFGKGPRRCPGQAAGVMMAKGFIAAFLSHNSNCRMSVPENQTKDVTWFNLFSKASFDIHCDG